MKFKTLVKSLVLVLALIISFSAITSVSAAKVKAPSIKVKFAENYKAVVLTVDKSFADYYGCSVYYKAPGATAFYNLGGTLLSEDGGSNFKYYLRQWNEDSFKPGNYKFKIKLVESKLQYGYMGHETYGKYSDVVKVSVPDYISAESSNLNSIDVTIPTKFGISADAKSSDGYTNKYFRVLSRATSPDGPYTEIYNELEKRVNGGDDSLLSYGEYIDNTAIFGTKYYYKLSVGVCDSVKYSKKNLKKASLKYSVADKANKRIRYLSKLKELTTKEAAHLSPAAPTKLTYKTVSSKNVKVSWTKSTGVDKYNVYKATTNGKKKFVAETAGTSVNVSGLKHAVLYDIYVEPVKKNEIGDEFTGPMLNSTVSFTYYTSCYESIYDRIWPKKASKMANREYTRRHAHVPFYKSNEKAMSQMKTVTIKAWDFESGTSGKKITKTYYLTVHKKVASSVKKAFDEIYNSEEQFPINSIGAYSYRWGAHGMGLAIDINPNENAYFQNGKPVVGTLYKPDKNPYSIGPNSEFARILYKYGMYQLEGDYMHFSFTGT
ncbi:MAG: fibronectin type III domain-containing protein [Lachnospiraceae bacterium]|nr:fibronectin type III domain-containing protein [Lachnospiraceae bacterium]